MERDPFHPIIERPFQYKIVELCYQEPSDGSEAYIDLGLRKGNLFRRLRFLGPQDLKIDQGFPNSSGLTILDVRARQMDGLNVQVVNLKPIGGCPEFWARAVIDVTSEGEEKYT